MTVSHDERALARQLAQVRKVRRKEAKQARPKNLKADRGRQRDNAHLAFIRRLPCVATFARTGRISKGPSDAAHVRFADVARGKAFTGAGRKPDDRWTVPLCRAEHERQHAGNERAYWASLGVDVLGLCERLYAVSGDIEAGTEIIRGLRGSVVTRERE